jgi:ribosomal protein L37AE/L43A
MPEPTQPKLAEHDPIQTRWEHAHRCQACGHTIRIDDIDAKVIATGIVTCRRCGASGPVNVKIVDERHISELTHPFAT